MAVQHTTQSLHTAWAQSRELGICSSEIAILKSFYRFSFFGDVRSHNEKRTLWLYHCILPLQSWKVFLAGYGDANFLSGRCIYFLIFHLQSEWIRGG